MSRDTLASLRERIAYLEQERDEASLAFKVAYDEQRGNLPVATERAEAYGWSYRFDLYRVKGGCAGIVRIVGRSKTTPCTSVAFYPLDGKQLCYPHLPLRIAVDRLKVARQRIYDAECAA